MSFVPNLEACRCLLLIFDASFDILFTFLPDMQRKHLYQSVSCTACIVRMSGLPYSLHFWGEGCVLCSLVCRRANPGTEMCCTNSASEEEINMYPKSQFQLKKKTLNPKIYEVVNCELRLTFRGLESSQCSFLCWIQITISIVNPLQSYLQTMM